MGGGGGGQRARTHVCNMDSGSCVALQLKKPTPPPLSAQQMDVELQAPAAHARSGYGPLAADASMPCFNKSHRAAATPYPP